MNKQSGFTLIELMIVVAIIGILASLSMQAFQSYTIRAQVSEGLTMAARAKSAVAEYYAQTGDWPNDNDEAGLADKHDIVGNYVEHLSVGNNEIEIKYEEQSHDAIHGKKIYLTATDNGGGRILWTCTSDGDIPRSYLPSVCR